MAIIGKDVELGRLGCRTLLAVAGNDSRLLTGSVWITAQLALVQGYMTGDLRRICRRIASMSLDLLGKRRCGPSGGLVSRKGSCLFRKDTYRGIARSTSLREIVLVGS